MSYPQEPGLYWASTAISGKYDSIVRIYGEAPFLKVEVISLHVNQFHEIIDPYRREIPIIGPRVDIPKVSGGTENDKVLRALKPGEGA